MHDGCSEIPPVSCCNPKHVGSKRQASIQRFREGSLAERLPVGKRCPAFYRHAGGNIHRTARRIYTNPHQPGGRPLVRITRHRSRILNRGTRRTRTTEEGRRATLSEGRTGPHPSKRRTAEDVILFF